jgi:hypothetical protein
VGSVVVLAATPTAAQAGTGSVSGVLWFDDNGDGQRNTTTEMLLRNVQVGLFPCVTLSCATTGPPALPAGTLPQFTSTNDVGAYTFPSVPVGKWRVRVTGASPTAVATGKFVGAGATDSHLSPSFESDLLTVTSGSMTYSGIDGGLWDCMSNRTTYTVRGATSTSNEATVRYPSNFNVYYTDGAYGDGWSTANSTADLRSVRWNVPWAFNSSVARWPVKFDAGNASVCMVGGDNKVNLPATAPWAFGWPPTYNLAECGKYPDPSTVLKMCEHWKSTGGLNVRGPGFNVRGANIHDVGDGIAIAGASEPAMNPHNWSIKGTRIADGHDDCVENDGGFKGSLDDTLLDGCYVGYSDDSIAQTYPAGEGVVITNTLIRMKEMPGTFCMDPTENRHTWYDPRLSHDPGFVPESNAACRLNAAGNYQVTGYTPGHNQLFKFHTSAEASLTMRNSIVYAKTASQVEDMSFPKRAGLPRIDYTDPERCSNNTLYWDGTYDTLPTGWKPIDGWSTDADPLNDWPRCFTIKTTDKILNATANVAPTALSTNVWYEWSIIRQLWLNAHSTGGGFTPLASPQRAYDSGATLIGTLPTEVTLPTDIGLPPVSEIGAVVVNVTAYDPSVTTFLQAWGNDPRPSTSIMSFNAGETRTNGATIAPDVSSGSAKIRIGTYGANARVSIDVVGFYRKYENASDLVYVPAPTTKRLLDTSAAPASPLTAGTERFVDVPTSSADPNKATAPAGATAIIANITAVNPGATTQIKAYPANLSSAQISSGLPINLSAASGSTVANQTVIRLDTNNGASGTRGFDLMNMTGTTNVTVDVVGWYMPSGTTDGLYYYPVTPTRVADTTSASLADGPVAKVVAGTPRAMNLRRGPGGGARVANINISIGNVTGSGSLKAYPTYTLASPPAVPAGPQLSFLSGQLVSNNAALALGDNRNQPDIGKATFAMTGANADVFVDLTGYFAPPNQIKQSPYSAIP